MVPEKQVPPEQQPPQFCGPQKPASNPKLQLPLRHEDPPGQLKHAWPNLPHLKSAPPLAQLPLAQQPEQVKGPQVPPSFPNMQTPSWQVLGAVQEKHAWPLRPHSDPNEPGTQVPFEQHPPQLACPHAPRFGTHFFVVASQSWVGPQATPSHLHRPSVGSQTVAPAQITARQRSIACSVGMQAPALQL